MPTYTKFWGTVGIAKPYIKSNELEKIMMTFGPKKMGKHIWKFDTIPARRRSKSSFYAAWNYIAYTRVRYEIAN